MLETAFKYNDYNVNQAWTPLFFPSWPSYPYNSSRYETPHLHDVATSPNTSECCNLQPHTGGLNSKVLFVVCRYSHCSASRITSIHPSSFMRVKWPLYPRFSTSSRRWYASANAAPQPCAEKDLVFPKHSDRGQCWLVLTDDEKRTAMTWYHMVFGGFFPVALKV